MEPLIFIGIFFGVFGLISIFMFAFVYRIRIVKIKEKLDKKRLESEIEMDKKRLDFEIEKERAKITPRYCRYCGAKHDADAKSCTVCGATL